MLGNRNATTRGHEQSKRRFHTFIRFSIGCHATEHGNGNGTALADKVSFRASLCSAWHESLKSSTAQPTLRIGQEDPIMA